MERLRGCSPQLWLAAWLVLAPAAAAAEPVTITSGTLTAAGLNISPHDFMLIGDGFSITGRGADSGSSGLLCAPCLPGDVISFDSLFSGSALGSGSATVEDVSYPAVWYGGVLAFTGPQVTFPDGSGTVVVRSPFELGPAPPRASLIVGYLTEMRDLPAFTIELAGTGSASATFTEGPAGFFTFNSVTYAFSSSPAPVPEPATLVLVGGALAGVGARRWRRRGPRGSLETL
jgi:hypothetical protein